MMGRSQAERETHPSTSIWRLLLMVGATSFYVPLTVLADHPGFVTRDYRLVVLALCFLLVGLGAVWALGTWMGRRMAADLVFVIMLFLMLGGRTSGPTPAWTIGATAVALLMVVLVIRLQGTELLGRLLPSLAVALWLLVLVRVVVAITTTTVVTAEAGTTPGQIEAPAGDVVIVIFDEYPGATFAATDLGVDMSQTEAALASRGFEVWGDIRANYAWSELALPSFFDMRLPKAQGDLATEATRPEFLGAIGGESRFVHAFKQAGFRFTLVESGWSGLRCMAVVDQCVVRSWYDEVAWSVARRSILNGAILDLAGDPFTIGVERNLAWLREELPGIVGDDDLDLVVVHLQLPHTPVVFGEDCQVVVGRRAEMREQVECANRTMLEIADLAPSASVVVYFGDHGTKTMNQGSVPVADWSQEMIDERMVTFAATRGMSDCPEPPPSSVTNLAVKIIRCLGSAGPAYVRGLSLATSLNGETLLDVNPSLLGD